MKKMAECNYGDTVTALWIMMMVTNYGLEEEDG
jgi:hypothetical protein